MIAEITRVVIRTYTDSGDVKAYVEWLSDAGEHGCIEGKLDNQHMMALIRRAEREGIEVERQIW